MGLKPHSWYIVGMRFESRPSHFRAQVLSICLCGGKIARPIISDLSSGPHCFRDAVSIDEILKLVLL